ncbi:phosphotransferase IIA-like nitrogen-regulatory protein PtsN [Pacificibacter maritimus]|uniref:Phosphotransferase IIA-like nitrogen-regulatory protein PtsN n=1 Tax=Pacificibacter maritimus TaxID=762213 RepID=A0A3N4UBX4_9RHOB|nr:PTS sugar transporter subunit IIA [Pacificibacter maritimus]RPE64661.1 phosphotransferase IIA-like nitrogen-regulatory protein PtsN [Pacificibacter maritimus]
MKLSELLQPSAVKVVGKLTSKKRLFQDLGEVAAASYGLDLNGAINSLQERESLGPTGVGHGIALPHARIEGLERVVGAFFKLDTPLDFDAVDRQPVDLIFALFAPAESGVDHLKALALVSRTMRDEKTCTKLRANADAATLHAILTSIPSSKVA